MEHGVIFEEVLRLIEGGRIKDARSALVSRKHALQQLDPALYRTLLADLELNSGDIASAQSNAKTVLAQVARKDLLALAHRVIGELLANQEAFDESLDHYAKARAICGEDVPAGIAAGVELSYWRWFSGVLPLTTSQTEFSTVRKAVLRSGHAHHLIELRLCTARTEARKGNLFESQRHLDLARRLLASHLNVKLSAQLELDSCLLCVLKGELELALVHAREAGRLATESGYFRAIVASLIDAGHVLHSLGRFTEALETIETALAQIDAHHNLRVAALDCLANILVSQGDLTRAEAVFEEITHYAPKAKAKTVLHWDTLSILWSRLELARVRNRYDEVEKLLKSGLETAKHSGDSGWLVRLQLASATLSLEAGRLESAIEPLAKAVAAETSSPELMARTAATISLASAAVGGDRASGAYLRARRIADTLGNAELTNAVNRATQVEPPNERTNPTLDDAVAFIELAGYPHVLAREAYALLESSNAAEAIALVARGDQGVRSIASQGWTDAEVAAVAADTDNLLRIACGGHRDEAWEVLARIRPTLADRCTGVAIRKLVETAVTLDRYRREEKQRAALWPADTLETDGGLWVSEQMTSLLSLARRIAPSDVTVLLTGETGTGKEILARAIHRASTRAAKPFVPFNCTAVPRDMLDSQLFGYRRGAFTGAETAFEGVIRGAAGGTLFLDEIGEIGPDVQTKLLRFLETHEIHPLGEPQPIKVDVRIIAATNADLESLMSEGRVREDLFYRLNVVRLKLPPLRERREEIPPLIEHYLRRFAEELKKGRLSLDDETLEYLLLYAWPGNVRQLVNEVRRLVVLAEVDGTIVPALLAPEIQASRRTIRLAAGDEPEIRIRMDQPLNEAVELIEQAMVKRALQRAHGNYENAARLLGISRKGLFLKRRRWGMQRAS